MTLNHCFLSLKNVGGHFEQWNTGILGPVALHGLDQGKWDLSWQKWTYQVVYLTLKTTFYISHSRKYYLMVATLNRLGSKEKPCNLSLQMVFPQLNGCVDH